MNLRSLLITSFSLLASAAFQCQNDARNSAAVDSWFAIKEPKGSRYVYYDSQTPLSPSLYALNDTAGGALTQTLKQLWTPNTEYILFNDEPPVGNANNATVGHIKAVWAWNGDQAFVLAHSIPLFPKGPGLVPAYQGLGGNAYTYAQSLGCFSFSLSTLNSIAMQMGLTIPNIYDKKISQTTPVGLKNLANGLVSKQARCNSTAIQTMAGAPVTHFAKSTAWNNELYSQCIAPALKQSLFAETWIRGSATGPSCSGNFHVNDVTLLNLPFNDTYKETQDHSKWAVGSTHVCVADINRMTTQFKRGGGAFCIRDSVLAASLNSTIVATNTC